MGAKLQAVKMASAMHQTMQTCANLATMLQTQMLDEDKIDPFPARTTTELEEMLDACRRTKEVLSREALIYSNEADFSNYSDSELLAMNQFVRENSRMLSVILAGGKQHFWNGQGLSTVQELKNMYYFIDDKVKEFLMLDKVMDTLEIKMRYGRQSNTPKNLNPATHPELLAFTTIDANRAPTSQESLLRLANVCEKFAVQCRGISQMRVEKMEDRKRKAVVKEMLLVEVDSLLPMLRQHVLKIGLSKTQLQHKDAKAEAKGQDKFGGSNSHKLTSLFTHAAVEDAHRAVEDCRERLMQEMLFRRSKVERRLKAEEDKERERGRSASAGDSARPQMNNYQDLQSYQGLLSPGSPDSPKQGRSLASSPDQSRSQSPARSTVRKSESPGPKARAASPSPKSPGKSQSPAKKGGSKDAPKKANASQEGSLRKSPKARSKKAAQ